MDEWKKAVISAVNQGLDGKVAFEAAGGARLLLDVDVEFISPPGSETVHAFEIDSITTFPPGVFTSRALPSIDAEYFANIIVHEISHLLGAPDESVREFFGFLDNGSIDATKYAEPSHMADVTLPVKPSPFWQLAVLIEQRIAPALVDVGYEQFNGPWKATEP